MKEITDKLYAVRDTEYAAFQQKLIPTLPLERFIGVRTPLLRKMAKELWKDAAPRDAFLQELPHFYYDENQLHFFTICEDKDFDRCMEQVERFLPYVDNWSTCDQPFPKVFEKHYEKLHPYIEKWLGSGETYTMRFAIGTIMRLYLDEDFHPEYLEKVAAVSSEEYYVNMMIAWYLATALAKQWDSVIPLIEAKRLPVWVHNKTIQKAKESFRITKEQKDFLNSLKRK